jgi:hypothetical protein
MPFRSFSRYALAAAASVAIAGCSSGFRSLPMSSEQSPQSAMNSGFAPVIISFEPADDAWTAFATSSCKYPVVCVKQGGKGTLSIKAACYNKQQIRVACGTVHWTTKTSNNELKGSFKPDPGNPTKETVTASRTIKPGNYTQTLTVTCSRCTESKKATYRITVQKK